MTSLPFKKFIEPRVAIFIKPWDDEVFACFLQMLK
jgi:hypothetical protein